MKRFFALILSVCIVSATGLGLTSLLQSYSQAQAYWETSDPEQISSVGSPYKFYFSTLDNKSKHTYNAILSEILDMPEKIEIPNIRGFELEKIFSALLNDNPELFFLSRVCSLEDYSLKYDRFVPQYVMSRQEYSDCLAELNAVAGQVESSFAPGDDAAKKELKIHDYITANCEYLLSSKEAGDPTSWAYGALVNGQASCEGYSKAMKLLLDRAGINNAVVTGEATNVDGETVNHMWNAVEVGSGWYYVDCTWDDPVGDSGGGVFGHAYFNLSKAMISSSHSNFSYDFPCEETAENYHVRAGLYFEQYDASCEKRLEDIILEQLGGGNGRIEIRFAGKKAYENAVEQLFESEQRSIDRILYHVMQKSDIDFSQYFKYVPDGLQYVLTLVISLEEE